MVWPNPNEIAVLIVNGQKFDDWETIQVKHAFYQRPGYFFRFTCSEDSPISKNWAVMRIRPGDDCQITLAGQPAFSGFVSTRQVFYNGRRHYVEIQGSDYTGILDVTSTVTKTQEYKNVTAEQFIRAQISPYSKLKFVVEGGGLPNFVFDRISLPHGMSTFDTIDLHTRVLGNFPITSNPQGNLVVIAGPSGGSDTVVEGKNILEGREIIFNQGAAQSGSIPALAHRTGNDNAWGANISHVPFFTQTFQNLGTTYGPIVVPLEVPGWTQDHLKGRSNAERDWLHQDQITLYITVHGWLRPSGGLWYRNQKVNVISPMLIMDGSLPLTLKSVTFLQDDNVGTRSILELCNEAALSQLPGLPASGPSHAGAYGGQT